MNFYNLIFLMIYILGNYYFFPKKNALAYLYSYLCTTIIMLLIFPDLKLLIPIFFLFLINLLFYSFESYGIKNKKSFVSNKFFCLINPILNLVFILLISNFYIYWGIFFKTNSILLFYDKIPQELSFSIIFKYCLAFLIAGNFSNKIIRDLLLPYQPKEKKKDNNLRTGAFIGTLERILVLLLFSLNQFAAAGLVFTAKSIARYNKIAEDQTFAEYYLLGTLLSLLFALGINYLILFN